MTPRPEGGCHIEVQSHRQARGFKGQVIGTILTPRGRKVLSKQLHQTLDIVANETGSPALATEAVR